MNLLNFFLGFSYNLDLNENKLCHNVFLMIRRFKILKYYNLK